MKRPSSRFGWRRGGTLIPRSISRRVCRGGALRWRDELVPNASIVVAEQGETLIGFVTVDPKGYLNQLVVSPDHWGSEAPGNALIDEAKRLSPDGIALLVNIDNARAIRFYERNGFARKGSDVNPTSGRPVLRMEWKP